MSQDPSPIIAPVPRLFVSFRGFCEAFCCEETRGRRLANAYNVKLIRNGRRTLIPVEEITRVAALLPEGKLINEPLRIAASRSAAERHLKSEPKKRAKRNAPP